jgi:hypothetical protein
MGMADEDVHPFDRAEARCAHHCGAEGVDSATSVEDEKVLAIEKGIGGGVAADGGTRRNEIA